MRASRWLFPQMKCLLAVACSNVSIITVWERGDFYKFAYAGRLDKTSHCSASLLRLTHSVLLKPEL